MSLPKYNAPPSPLSSSRKSLRNPRTIESPVSELKQQRKLDHTAPRLENGLGEETLLPQNERQDVSPSSKRQFKPFFNVIKDTNSSEYYHPTVHYIFSDDDTDLITEAAFRSLEIDNASAERGLNPREEQQDSTVEAYDRSQLENGQSSLRKHSLLPPPIPGVKERYLILDVDSENIQLSSHSQPRKPDVTQAAARGVLTSSASTPPPQSQAHQIFKVTSAHSLTPDWQVLSTQLSPAPTFDTPNNAPSGEPSTHPPNGALMLHIEGTTGLPRYVPSRENKDALNWSLTLEDTTDQFEKRMNELRRVIEAGGLGAKELVDVQEQRESGIAKDGNE
jgi:hypothetical protein